MNDRHFDQHVSEEQLIRALDGELDRASRLVVESHLESCWGCRHKQERLRQTVDRFTEWETILLRTSEAQPPAGFSDFPGKLRAAYPPASRQRPSQAILSRGLTLVSSMAAMLTVTVWLWPVPVVSAKEILDRSAQSETAAFRQVANPLVLQRVRVESRRRKAEGAFWTAPSAGKSKRQWGPGSDAGLRKELEQIYSSNGLDLRRPLSVANHAAWRQSIADHTDEVVEHGNSFVLVRTRNSGVARNGEIAEAELLLRASDWHPVEQTLTIAGQSEEYRIVETGYEVKPMLTAEAARLFAPEAPLYAVALPMEPALNGHTAIPTAPDTIPPILPSPPPSLQDLLDTEVEALARLHLLEADRAEAARVTRQQDTVEVTVYAADEERAQAIGRELAPLPHLRLTVHGLQQAPPPQAQESGVTLAPEKTEQPLFLQELVATTGSLPAANLIVSRHLELLRRLKSETASLQALTQRFPEPLQQELSPESRQQLDGLRLDHLDAARHYWTQTADSSTILLSTIGAAASGDSPADSCQWPRAAEELAFAARRIEELYSRAFTVVAGADTALRWMTKGSLREEIASLHAALSTSLERCRP
jgi:hypothetical protein